MTADLSRLRFPVEKSLGRKYPEPAHSYRTGFQRDRDRIVHARAFRRLEDKTQVFSPGISDHFRTRLTHTIEVAQIARTVSAALGLEEDLTEALALAHDIGHPPFGHAGEQELDRQMARFGDRFDHNLHALRIVESFEQRYARFPGLNLTFEVREGIVKHSRDLEPGQDGGLAEYLPDLRPPLEAQLIDLADEIAYNTADLDDGHAAGLFGIDQVSAEVPRYHEIHDRVQMQFPGAPERVQFHESLRLLIDGLVSGLIDGTLNASLAAGVSDLADVRRYPSRLACFLPQVASTNQALKRFLHANLYGAAPLAAERGKSVAFVGELFDYYLEDPRRLPQPYAAQAASQAPHRVICDYIAGMTNGFLLRTCRQLREVAAN